MTNVTHVLSRSLPIARPSDRTVESMAVRLMLVMAAMLMLLALVVVHRGQAAALGPRASSSTSPMPSAEEYGEALVTATNAHAREHDGP